MNQTVGDREDKRENSEIIMNGSASKSLEQVTRYMEVNVLRNAVQSYLVYPRTHVFRLEAFCV